MALYRYNSAPPLSFGKFTGTYENMAKIHYAVKAGRVTCKNHILKESERLDIIAGKVYKNSKLWWVIAAASGIGWALQVPPGTVISIPNDLDVISQLL